MRGVAERGTFGVSIKDCGGVGAKSERRIGVNGTAGRVVRAAIFRWILSKQWRNVHMKNMHRWIVWSRNLNAQFMENMYGNKKHNNENE